MKVELRIYNIGYYQTKYPNSQYDLVSPTMVVRCKNDSEGLSFLELMAKCYGGDVIMEYSKKLSRDGFYRISGIPVRIADKEKSLV